MIFLDLQEVAVNSSIVSVILTHAHKLLNNGALSFDEEGSFILKNQKP